MRSRRSPCAVLVLSLALALAPPVHAQSAAIEGAVLDLTGSPLPDVGVATRDAPGAVLAFSGADGSFRIARSDVKERDHLIVAESEPYRAASMPGSTAWDGGRPVLLVAAPAVEVAGRLVDGEGRPVRSGLSYTISPLLLSAFPLPLDDNRPAYAHVPCDEDGRFRALVPAVPGAELIAVTRGASARIPMPPESQHDLEAVVAPPPALDVRGVVRGASGEAVAGARVAYATVRTTADESGGFRLAVNRRMLRPDAYLSAEVEGRQTALAPDLAARVAASDAGEILVDLSLGESPLSISGRVVDAEGQGLRGWSVELHDGTVLNRGIMRVRLAEHGAGGRVRNEPVATAPDGSFRIDGLYDRPYVLDAWDGWGDPVAIRSEPIAAGTDGVELRLESDAFHETFRGRVVDPAGAPLPGVAVEMRLDLPLVVQGHHNSLFYPDPVWTDADGRFTLRRMPRRHASIEVSGDAVLPALLISPEHVSVEPATFVAERRTHVRVILAPGALPIEEIAFLGPGGDEMDLLVLQAGKRWSQRRRLALQAGGTPPLAVSGSACTLVAYRGGAEVSRRDVVLQPGRVNAVTLE